MRRFIGVVVVCLSLGLIAAAPPTPSPRPAGFATPPPSKLLTSAAPSVSTLAPTVVIYPFDAPSDVNPNTGEAIAQIYAQVLVQSGGLTILNIPKNIKREDYTKYAHAQHADYYIAGYVQPIGQGAAIVSQIVDVNQDILVYSQTTQIDSVPDVGSQALASRDIILRSAGVDRPQVSTAESATPTPSATQGASVSVTNVLGGLFKGRAKPGASAAATPKPAKPARAVIVAPLGGNAGAGELKNATDELFRAMNGHFTTSLAANGGSIPKQADAICGTNRNNTIASGTLDAQRVGGIRAHSTYSFTLDVYTCFGAVLYTNTQTGDDKVKVVRDAVDAYVAEHPANT